MLPNFLSFKSILSGQVSLDLQDTFFFLPKKGRMFYPELHGVILDPIFLMSCEWGDLEYTGKRASLIRPGTSVSGFTFPFRDSQHWHCAHSKTGRRKGWPQQALIFLSGTQRSPAPPPCTPAPGDGLCAPTEVAEGAELSLQSRPHPPQARLPGPRGHFFPLAGYSHGD